MEGRGARTQREGEPGKPGGRDGTGEGDPDAKYIEHRAHFLRWGPPGIKSLIS